MVYKYTLPDNVLISGVHYVAASPDEGRAIMPVTSPVSVEDVGSVAEDLRLFMAEHSSSDAVRTFLGSANVYYDRGRFMSDPRTYELYGEETGVPFTAFRLERGFVGSERGLIETITIGNVPDVFPQNLTVGPVFFMDSLKEYARTINPPK